MSAARMPTLRKPRSVGQPLLGIVHEGTNLGQPPNNRILMRDIEDQNRLRFVPFKVLCNPAFTWSDLMKSNRAA